MKTKQIRVLLINPSIPFGLRVEEPLAVVCLATYLLEHGVDARIINMQSESFSKDKFRRILLNYQPDVVGLSAMTVQFASALNLAVLTKQFLPQTKVVIGGVHVTALPEESAAFPFVDAIVKGRGEIPLLRLCKAWKMSGDITEIPGVVTTINHKVISGPPVEEFDISRMPVPRHDLILKRKPFISRFTPIYRTMKPMVETAVGCPKKCSYCCRNIMGTSEKNIEKLIEELKNIKGMGFENIIVTDSDIFMSPDRLSELCKAIIRAKIGMNMLVNGSVDTFIKAPLDLVSKAGINAVYFGVESGDEKLRCSMNKYISNDDIRLAFAMARKYDISAGAFIMLGYPGENEETIQNTRAFLEELKPDRLSLSIFTPFPGSSFFRDSFDMNSRFLWRDFAFAGHLRGDSKNTLPNYSDISRERLLEHYTDLFMWHKKYQKDDYFLKSPFYYMSDNAGKMIKSILKDGVLKSD